MQAEKQVDRSLVGRVFSLIRKVNPTELQRLEQEVLKSEKLLEKLIDIRNVHHGKAPVEAKLPLSEIDSDQLLNHEKDIDREKRAKECGAWKKVDIELSRRIMAARRTLSEARERLAIFKWQPLKERGDASAENIASMWPPLEEQLEELERLERLEVQSVGMKAKSRFNPRAVQAMRETVKPWINR